MTEFKLTKDQQELADKITHLGRMTVINMVSGQMSQRKAYYAAGGQAKTDASADASVARLLGDVRVKAFYDSLVASSVSSSVMTREQALERLTKIAFDEDDRNSMQSIKQLCDMQGWEAPKKLDTNMVVSGRVQFVPAKMDQDEREDG